MAAGGEFVSSLVRGLAWMRRTGEFGEVNLDHVLVFLILAFVVLVVLELGVARIKDDLHVAVAAEVVHEDSSGSTLVKVGAGLLEERVDGELEIERLDFDLAKVLGERCGLTSGLFAGSQSKSPGQQVCGKRTLRLFFLASRASSSPESMSLSSASLPAPGKHGRASARWLLRLLLLDSRPSSARPLSSFPVSVATLSTLLVQILTQPSRVQLAF